MSTPQSAGVLGWGFRSIARLTEHLSEVRGLGKKVAVFIAPRRTRVDPRFRDRTGLALGGENIESNDSIDLGLTAYLIKQIAAHIDPDIPVIDLGEMQSMEGQNHPSLYYKDSTLWSKTGHTVAGLAASQHLAIEWFNTPLDLSESEQNQLLEYSSKNRPNPPLVQTKRQLFF